MRLLLEDEFTEGILLLLKSKEDRFCCHVVETNSSLYTWEYYLVFKCNVLYSSELRFPYPSKCIFLYNSIKIDYYLLEAEDIITI